MGDMMLVHFILIVGISDDHKRNLKTGRGGEGRGAERRGDEGR